MRSRAMIWIGLILIGIGLPGCGGDTVGPPHLYPDSIPADSLGTGVGLEQVATGLAFPVFLTAPAGDTARLFVLEKGGRIRVIRHDTLLPTPFLDLSDAVSTGSEQGLLGLAFPPDFQQSGWFVVDYTAPNGETHISRFRVGADPAAADRSSEAILLTIPQPYANHNGGMVEFGPDGMLYVGVGDGGSAGDPQHHAQNPADLLGSLLRIGVGATGGYQIPQDNPFAAGGGRGEIWAYGLRNPWRFSFDPANGDLYIGDVGQSAREEIDVAAAGGGRGANYGWNIMEGTTCYQATVCDQSGLTLPVLDYTHDSGCSVTGGYVYRGTAVPALSGAYLYADYCAGWVRSFVYRDGQAADRHRWPDLTPGGSLPSFGRDARGELYLLDAGGTVYRIVAR